MVDKLKVLQGQILICTKCELHKTKTNYVISRGSSEAKLMIVGEAPGEDEDLQGKPFVGKSGQLLDKALIEIGLSPDTDVYVCNIIKCRPPGNRRPSDEESNNCINYLDEQISIINPKIILALGNTSFHNLVNTDLGITKAHGKQFKRYHNKIAQVVLPTFHPSFILRQGGTSAGIYQEFKKDLQIAKGLCYDSN